MIDWLTAHWLQLLVLGSLWSIAVAIDRVRGVLVEIHIDQAALRERYAPRLTAEEYEDLALPPPPAVRREREQRRA